MKFEENIKLIYGDKGVDWLKNLPNLIKKLADKWNLSNLIPYQDLTYNYILKGKQGQNPIVLKLGIDLANIKKELEALIAFKNLGVVNIIDEDHINGAILLEEAIPGNTLISLFPGDDIKAIEIACKLADSLHYAHIPENHSFTFLSSLLEIIDKDWALPGHILVRARELKKQLLKESKSQVLLHGDLHYGNIISHKNSWIAIDPAGVIGDPLFDIAGVLLREPLELLIKEPKLLLENRVEFVAKYTEKPKEIIYDWLYLQTILSICWSLEDAQDVSIKLQFLEILSYCETHKEQGK